jgi:DNA repair photolyase
MADNYQYSISISSQIPHCSLPLRLDSYSKCSFRCSYCFAKNRGGNHPPKGLKVIDHDYLDRVISKSLNPNSGKLSVIGQLLKKQVPVHFGGMSDPFMHYEESKRSTLNTLKVLKKHRYPTIISTKGDLIIGQEYLEVLAESLVTVQVSFSTLNDIISKQIEFNTPLPSSRLKVIKELSKICFVSARLQPLIPGNIELAMEAISTLAEAGVKHISVELLKLSLIDSSGLSNLISSALSGLKLHSKDFTPINFIPFPLWLFFRYLATIFWKFTNMSLKVAFKRFAGTDVIVRVTK